jgi:LPS O-antigen subunit length determinant protein (WzzB/FepE family)
MNCPPKIIVIATVLAIVGSSVGFIVHQSWQAHEKLAPPERELPAAISNYSKTFKLNTNPPIWKAPANGRNTTN